MYQASQAPCKTSIVLVVKSVENKKSVVGQFAVKYKTETCFWTSHGFSQVFYVSLRGSGLQAVDEGPVDER